MKPSEAAKEWGKAFPPVLWGAFTGGIFFALKWPEYARALESGLSGPIGGEDDQEVEETLRELIERFPIDFEVPA